MGRPSLVNVRTEEILQAVEQSILEVGVDGTTVANVARIAGMRPSHVRHYVGDRDAMMSAAVRRAVERVEEQFESALADVAGPGRLDPFLDTLFGAQLAVPQVNQMVDELIAAAYRDDAIKDLVVGMYERFAAIVDDNLAEAFPEAATARRRQLAHTLLALTSASATFEWMQLDPDHYRHVRRAANLLLTDLDAATGDERS